MLYNFECFQELICHKLLVAAQMLENLNNFQRVASIIVMQLHRIL